ncbi:MAG: Hsp20/alpha crystallin family protein [Acidimicrobiia bacterium]
MDDHPRHLMVQEATARAEAELPTQRLPVNLYEAGDAIVAVAPVPAVQTEDVEVSLVAGRLVISARLRTAAPKDYLLHEWNYGAYEREVELPEGYGAGMEATLANGQLAVRVLRGDPVGAMTIHPDSPSRG